MNLKYSNLYISSLVVLFSVFCFLFSPPVFASELFLQMKTQEFSQGDEFIVNVSLNTTGDSINSIQADVSFPEALLELKEIRDGGSIINFWADKPKIAQAGVVSFSGLVLGGYKGTNGVLFSLVFLAKSKGTGTISFDNSAEVLLNDGKGTASEVKVFPLKFSVVTREEAPKLIIESINDIEIPEDFTPEVVQNSAIFSGKYFIVFSTQDSESGIDHYEIQETNNNQQGKNWVVAESPYVLQDQKLQSFIHIKAIDRAGNERIKVIEPRYPIKWYETWGIWFIITIIVIVIGYLIIRFLWEKYRNK